MSLSPSLTVTVFAWAVVGVWQTSWGALRALTPDAELAARLPVECLCTCDVHQDAGCHTPTTTTTTAVAERADPSSRYGASWAALFLRLALELALCSVAALLWVVRGLASRLSGPAKAAEPPPRPVALGDASTKEGRRAARKALAHLAVDASTL